MHIKTFGIQRSGTNYLEYIKNNNIVQDIKISKFPKLDTFPMLNVIGGWKHNPVPRWGGLDNVLRIEVNNKAIVIIKNPYTWYTSIKRWIKITPHDWPWPSNTIEQIFERYNSLYEGHKDFLSGNVNNTLYNDSILIRYEDLILNNRHEFERIVDKFDVTLNDGFKDTNKIDMSDLFTDERRKYYIEQIPVYRDNKEIMERVNDSVDWELMGFYGYEKIII